MRRKEILFLVVNIPATLTFLFLVLYLFSYLLSVTGTTIFDPLLHFNDIFLGCALLNIVLALMILKKMKVLSSVMVLLAVFEVFVLYVFIWYWFQIATS